MGETEDDSEGSEVDLAIPFTTLPWLVAADVGRIEDEWLDVNDSSVATLCFFVIKPRPEDCYFKEANV